MNREEAKLLANRMDEICDRVPNGLSHLKDALTFAIMDLRMYSQFDFKGSKFIKAVAFAKSIPEFADYDSSEFFEWEMQDEEYLKYMP